MCHFAQSSHVFCPHFAVFRMAIRIRAAASIDNQNYLWLIMANS